MDPDSRAIDPPAEIESMDEIDRWTAFHEQVQKLPVWEREVVDLRFYQGWSQAEISELLQVSERQIRRHWVKACERLRETLQDGMPDI